MSASSFDYKKLSITERIRLVEDIWDSIVAEAPDAFQLSEAQCTELRHRAQAHRADPAASIPWEQVREKLFQRDS